MNADSVMAITQAFPELPVQIGGGIRNMEIANAYIEAGIGYFNNICNGGCTAHNNVIDISGECSDAYQLLQTINNINIEGSLS
jgi:phosphoribosylformimino-5-aminoimidazole carboxamide ribonucleotide (ProFAR) isomerase